MKKFTSASILVLFVLVFATASCKSSGKKVEKETLQQEAVLMEVSIGGMSCTGCEQTVQTNIAKLEGIKSVKASFATGNAIVEYFPDMVDSTKIKEAVTGSGYIVKKFTTLQPGEAVNQD